MTGGAHGTKREQQVRAIAARLGVADFVYAASPVHKGSASREVSGDGLLMVGTRGAVLQVKSRDPSVAPTDTPDRAERWVRKNAKKAAGQGLGTRREITRRWRSGTPVVVSPVRIAHLPSAQRQKYDCTVSVDASSWPVIVVVDHPDAAGIDLGFSPGVVWFTFDDWIDLHRRLRSATAMLHYAERVLSDQIHVPLGHEGVRYGAMREADEQVAHAGPAWSVPYLAHSEHFDELGTDLFHDIIDKVWPDDGVIPWVRADDYRSIVEFLDAVPPETQASAGRWILRKRKEIASGHRRSSGVARVNESDRLVFTCSHMRSWPSYDDWGSEVFLLSMLRHVHGMETGAPVDSITLAVGGLVEDRPPATGVAYVFSLLKGQDAIVDLPSDVRRMMEFRYGRYDHRAGTVKKLQVNRNELCPCGSGKKFKRCCGG